MLQTLRQSVRFLLKSPGASFVAIASLALGIGANTTIFSLIDAVVLRPLPSVWRSDRLVGILDANGYTVSAPAYRDFAAGTRKLGGLAAYAPRTGSFMAGRTSAVGSVEVVSGNYFNVLGVPAALGRPLLPSDDRAGSDALVLAQSSWHQWFGGDPSVIGRQVSINGSPFTVVGIGPSGFKGARLGARPVGWITINAWPRIATSSFMGLDTNSRGWGWLQMVGRLREGATLDEARLDLNALARIQEREYPSGTPADFEVQITPLRVAATGVRTRSDLSRFVALLLGVVLAVLGVASANVSGLLVARTLSRGRELAIRAALGASRLRIASELLADGLVLAGLSAIAGVLVSMWTIDLLRKMQLPGGLDMSQVDVHISGVTVLATTVLALLAALAFSVAPALHGMQADVVSGLKGRPAAGAASRQAVRGALVATQLMLSLVLLVGTMLFARSLQATLSGDLGFNPRNLAYAATNVSLERYDATRARVLYQDVLDRLRGTPGIAAAAWTRLIPSDGRDIETVDVPGYVSPTRRTPEVSANLVTTGYFEAMGIPVLAGRAFTDLDTPERTPVAVVSQSAASVFWNGDALGRRFTINNTEVTVVGVARDVPPEPGAAPSPSVYRNALQLTEGALGTLYLVVRTDGDPAAAVPRLRDAIRAAGPTVPVLEARTMEEQLLDLLGAQRTAAALLGLLGFIALVLSAAGIYAMVAFTVSERTREFAVRMALGATAGVIRRLALAHAAAAVLAGVLLGLPLAWVLGRLSRRMLLELSPADPASFVLALAVLVTFALGASLIPAHRATKTDPLKALRAGTE